MTYAPATLQAVRNILVGVYKVPAVGVGIAPDSAHKRGYHCGLDTLVNKWEDYSAKSTRDRNGLAQWPNAASALDVTSNWNLHTLWIKALVKDYQDRQPYTNSIRDIITSFDGRNVVGFADASGRKAIANYGDDSHRWHTHISRYRDAHDEDVTDWVLTPLNGSSTMYKRLPASITNGRTLAQIAEMDPLHLSTAPYSTAPLHQLVGDDWLALYPGTGGPQTSVGYNALSPDWFCSHDKWPATNKQAAFMRALHVVLSRYSVFDTYSEMVEVWTAEVGSHTIRLADNLIRIAGGSTPANGGERARLLAYALGAEFRVDPS
jgi:hypothetical protein